METWRIDSNRNGNLIQKYGINKFTAAGLLTTYVDVNTRRTQWFQVEEERVKMLVLDLLMVSHQVTSQISKPGFDGPLLPWQHTASQHSHSPQTWRWNLWSTIMRKFHYLIDSSCMSSSWKNISLWKSHTSINELESKSILFFVATSLLLTKIGHLPMFFKKMDPSSSILNIALENKHKEMLFYCEFNIIQKGAIGHFDHRP